MSSKKYTSQKLVDKVKIIQALDKELKVNKQGAVQRVATQFKVPHYTVSRYNKERTKILSTFSNGLNNESTRIKLAKYPLLDERVTKWIEMCNSKGVHLNQTAIQEKAKQIANELSIENFKASNGWIEGLKARNGIGCIKFLGEETMVSESTVQEWRKKLELVCQEYEPKDIFNADETGLFYGLLPRSTYRVKGKVLKSGKFSKTRLTMLIGANMDGTEKLPVLVIGKSKKPRCFPNGPLPLEYTSNQKSWMTSEIFKNYLTKINMKMIDQDRHILLFIDNCPAHPQLVFSNIKLQFLPANTTSRLQPFDLGIIRSFKCKYREHLYKHFINSTNGEGEDATAKVNVYDAICWIKISFSNVTSETIKNCFIKAGFGSEAPQGFDEETPEALTNIGVDSEEFITCDDHVATCENMVPTDEVSESESIDIDLSDKEAGEEETEAPTMVAFSTESIKSNEIPALLKMIRLASVSGYLGDTISPLEKLEFRFDQFCANSRKQSQITDYFRPI